ncbi:MAG: hypothetical protein GVY26_08975 [Bacteroidetes bacterium]|jgi:hypothetical protein|nr:hypothetical protein [Bacteroidota bacterium]
MKLRTLLLLFFLPITTLTAQRGIAYYDALALSAAYELQEGKLPLTEDVRKLLLPYFDNPQEMGSGLADNPFLEPYFLSGDSLSLKLNAAAFQVLAEEQAMMPAVLPGLSGLDVTNVTTGLSRFMIERAREELTVAFFERFQRVAARNPEFSALFPLTTNRLGRLLEFQYGEMLPALRTAFQTDLERLIFRLDNFFRLEDYRELLEELPEVRLAIRLLRLARELESGKSPVALLEDLKELAERELAGEPRFQNLRSSLQLATLFTKSLRSIAPNRSLITFEEFSLLTQDRVALEVYFGLLYQQAEAADIAFTAGGQRLQFTAFLEQQRGNLFTIENYLMELLQLIERLEEIKGGVSFKQSRNVPLSPEEVDAYLQAALDVVQHALGIGVAMLPGTVRDRYYQILQQAQSLYRYLSAEEYTDAVLTASALLRNLLEAGDEVLPGFEYDKARIDRIAELLEYGLFMANMVQASSPAEIEATIANAALPAGSSSIKKAAGWNVAVQSYLGAYYRLDDPSATGTAWNNTFGLHAPVGIALSRGLGRGGSLSAFGALIDIGAAVDYELQLSEDPTTGNTVVERDYKIELGQIFSPGAYLVYGAPYHLPISLGVGGQYGPGLSSIESNRVVQDDPSWRWQVFLAVDIPLVNLWNRKW